MSKLRCIHGRTEKQSCSRCVEENAHIAQMYRRTEPCPDCLALAKFLRAVGDGDFDVTDASTEWLDAFIKERS
jgi:hypothetical protein